MLRFLLALLAVVPLNAQLVVDTYAGGAILSGVPAENVALGGIAGITWDPSGNVVFCDTANNVIRRVRTDGIIETIAGTGVTGFAGDGGLATSALINSPSSPQYDGAGNLYFLDSLNNRIRRIDTNGTITTVVGDGQITGLVSAGPATSLALPNDVNPFQPQLNFAVDVSGNIYIAAYYAGIIFRVAASGSPVGDLETFAKVSSPNGLVADGKGNVYVMSAALPNNILRVSPSGSVSTFATFTVGVFPNVVGLVSTDAAENVYVLLNGQLLRYDPDGASTLVNTPASITETTSYLAVNPQGNLAFAATVIPDAYVPIPVIQTFTNQSVLTTIAGGTPKPAPDGTPLRDAWFLGPLSIAFSPTGDLYIAEFGACLIRKISVAGVLSTFAGTGTCGYPTAGGKINLDYPYSIAVDSKSNVWVTDEFSEMYPISPAGYIILSIPTPVSGGKGALAIDGEDRVYVEGGSSLFRVLDDGTYTNIVVPSNGLFPVLSGIGADSKGNIYIVDEGAPVRGQYVIAEDGSITLVSPSLAGFTFDPSGNAWGSSGNLATTNSSGYAYIGLTPGFSGDGGPAQSANMKAWGEAFGPDGNLYFVDGNLSYFGGLVAGGNRIRRVTGSAPSAPPVIAPNGIVNAVSYAGGGIAPGELISIFGSNFGASSLEVNPAPNNALPHAIGRTKVIMNNAAVIAAITPNQINVFVPYELIPGTSVNVQVQVDNILSAPVSVPVIAAAPALSTSVVNQDGTLNSSTNPAPRGSTVTFYGTGMGHMTPQLADGYLAIAQPYSVPSNPYSMTIGGEPATVLYAGDAPGLSTGVFQINATIPTNITPGAETVALSVGGASGQVTIAIK
ncbi:MAG TPA: hypothetical protein VGG72_24780 [Bryobacteraceae bacterium]|jgi:uncharacterized protein (TIGR03437 family)